jgi:hypothetical protein
METDLKIELQLLQDDCKANTLKAQLQSLGQKECQSLVDSCAWTLLTQSFPSAFRNVFGGDGDASKIPEPHTTQPLASSSMKNVPLIDDGEEDLNL